MTDITSTFPNIPAVLTVEELAKYLHVGRNTAYNLVKSGEIPSIKIGRQIRIASDDVYRYLHKGA